MTHRTGSILLATEDRASRRFLTDNLAADGYRVTAVGSRAAALAALETTTPDAVIADVNGETLTLIDAVRGADGIASRIAPDTPLIVLTARRDELARIRYLDRGGDDVLAKPYRVPDVADVDAALYVAHVVTDARGAALAIDPTAG
jgi:DNA-binding response OmpR family regulator